MYYREYTLVKYIKLLDNLNEIAGNHIRHDRDMNQVRYWSGYSAEIAQCRGKLTARNFYSKEDIAELDASLHQRWLGLHLTAESSYVEQGRGAALGDCHRLLEQLRNEPY